VSSKQGRRVAAFGVVLLVAVIWHFSGWARSEGRAPVEPIPQWLLYPREAVKVLWRTKVEGKTPVEPEHGSFARYRPPDATTPVPHVAIPSHPFMATGGNNMHNDAYISDSYAASGPLGVDPQVISRTQGFGGYGTLAFDRAGRIVAVYSNGRGFQVELMDPDTLEELASYDLPARPWYFPLQGIMPWEYIGAGMYFYLDERDRAVVPTTRNTIQVIQAPAAGSDAGFEVVREYDLSGDVVPMSWPHQDSVAWVLPEWSGDRYWYATTAGVVGTVERASGDLRTRRLDAEIIENSFAVGEDGVFIVSDRALYRFGQDAEAGISIDWRTPYERGPASKPGHITRGSGASVTLIGGADGLVAITDNAEPRIHVQFFRRSDGAVVCSVPVFGEGKSGTDLSLAAFEHADDSGRGQGHYSALVENNWGHHRFPRSHPEPGLTRVDARRRPDGSYACEEVWASDEKSIGVFKLSLGSGLAYMYGRDESSTATGWYFIAIDFRTGKTVYRKHTGRGVGYNNWAGALFLHPDGGVASSTTIFGLVSMRDGASVPPRSAAPVSSKPPTPVRVAP